MASMNGMCLSCGVMELVASSAWKHWVRLEWQRYWPSHSLQTSKSRRPALFAFDVSVKSFAAEQLADATFMGLVSGLAASGFAAP
ncbi:hypothetical protein BI312_16255 [Xanthomonas citri pv. citri]|nr:Hypothetical Protein XCAW_00951 [Xanthomonas citri subsp. citri Aw12879]APR12437.1 hypothetical protein BI314_22030 [Xanthomonas citri pv. citri]APR17682.1 hypothetical protein BI315_16190 [Xanthomonas citri pv. citri]APR22110.1 hypothetical protein BI316_04235 [Xanthomonas citri pv. citri]APR25104.1 hypothetical protein BJD09_13710 [Xanthomonas citri pv. citri]